MSSAADANERMIRQQILSRGVCDPRVIEAFRSVPRDLFVPHSLRESAWDDHPLPLSCGQTISQPFIVALMTEILRLQPDDVVLEIGTGSGYQTAILAKLASRVCSAELEPSLAADASVRLRELGLTNVEVRVGDGVSIFREEGPFDAILSAAAPLTVPFDLTRQLREGGRCIIPVGPADQQHLYLIENRGGEESRRRLDPVRFVPLRRAAVQRGAGSGPK